MKNLRRLILLTLSATLLGGCSLFEPVKPSEETVTLEKLEAEGYTAFAYKDETYTFDGTVKAFYSNDTFKVVTNYSVSDLDTSKLGNSPLVISYTENNYTTNLSLLIPVVEKSSNVPCLPNSFIYFSTGN